MPESPLAKPLLVALGSDAQALKLIHTAFWRVRETGRPWVAVHVESSDAKAREELDQARLWLEEAQSLGASTLWIRAHTLVGGLLTAIRDTGADEILVGRSQDRWPWVRLGHSSAQELIRRQPAAQVHIVRLGAELPRAPLLPPQGHRIGAAIGALGILLACAGLSLILPPGQPLPAIFTLFLLGTAFIAQRWGLFAGASSVGFGALIFIHCFARPFFDHVPLALLFLVIMGGGQIAVRLSERLERQTWISRRRSALLASLLLLGRNLAKATTVLDVAEALAHLGERLLHRGISLVLSKAEGGWICVPPGADDIGHLPCPTRAQRSQLGPPELIFSGDRAFLPLTCAESSETYLCIDARDMSALTEEDWELLHAFAVQVILALERIQWLEKAQAERIQNETERLRSALLGAISHDLRTPLAGIQGAASTLLMEPENLDIHTRRDLLLMIHDESRRLTRLLTDLLDLTRLESGAIQIHKDWHPLEEIVGAALRQLGSGGANPSVRISLSDTLPLVFVDDVLLEQLLVNLLTNARRHAPDSPVDISAHVAGNRLRMVVSDRGPGIPEALRQRVFDKFFRMPGASKDGGAGLGLAICDAIAKVHGGNIWVENRVGGGASFHVELPLDSPPPAPPADEEEETA